MGLSKIGPRGTRTPTFHGFFSFGPRLKVWLQMETAQPRCWFGFFRVGLVGRKKYVSVLCSVGWFGWLVWFGLVWFGLVWVGLGWVGLGWVGLGWVGLGWVGLVLFEMSLLVGVGDEF